MEKLRKEDISRELILFIQSTIIDSSVSISEDTPFSQIGLDSMSIIEIVLFIERKFGVSISEKDMIPENLKSVNTLTDCTFKHL